jgi:hypothetical protein
MIGEGPHSTNQRRHTYVCDNVEVGFPLEAISFLLGALVSRFGWIAVGKISGRGPGIGFCLAEVT